MRPLIHIGYHKTATTWLQTQIFQPAFGFRQALDHAQINSLLIAPHDLDFDPASARASVQSALSAVQSELPVLSSENLSGHPFFGGRASASLAHRLHTVVPEARIMITIRSQNTMLPSVYMQYLKRGGIKSFNAFFAPPRGVGYPGFELSHFKYDRLIALYQSLFSDVFVVTYEAMAQQPEATLNNLRKQLGLSRVKLSDGQMQRVSASPNQAAAGLIRRANVLRRSRLNPVPLVAIPSDLSYRTAVRLGRLIPNSKPVETFVARTLAPEFEASNGRLSALTGGALDLSQYPQVASSPAFHGSELIAAAGP